MTVINPLRSTFRFLSDVWHLNSQFLKRKLSLRGTVLDKDLDYFTLYEDIHRNARPCFCLTTGRTGTLFLTEAVSSSSNIAAFHNPEPELVYYSRFAYEHPNESHLLTCIIDASRCELIQRSFLQDKVYFETNNRVTFFARQIASLFPQSRFIHIVRHPADFIRSGVGRQWYTGRHPHDGGRIVPCGPEKENWETWNQVRKIAWLWNETNGYIESFKQEIDPSRILYVKAEELFGDQNTLSGIKRFIGAEQKKDKTVKVNASLNNTFPKYPNWPDAYIKEARSQISPSLLDKYGYSL